MGKASLKVTSCAPGACLGEAWLLRAGAEQVLAEGPACPAGRHSAREERAGPRQALPWAFFLSAVFLLHDFQLATTEPPLKSPGKPWAAQRRSLQRHRHRAAPVRGLPRKQPSSSPRQLQSMRPCLGRKSRAASLQDSGHRGAEDVPHSALRLPPQPSPATGAVGPRALRLLRAPRTH